MTATNGDVKCKIKATTAMAAPIETPNTKWDIWDVRVFWGKSKMSTQAYPPGYLPISQYLFPNGQIWP